MEPKQQACKTMLAATTAQMNQSIWAAAFCNHKQRRWIY